MKSVASYVCFFALGAFLSACSDDDGGLESANPCTGSETDSSRLFLQQLSSSGVVIKWRGGATQICVGSDATALDTLAGSHRF